MRWQHRYYVPLSLAVCFALPTAIGHAMGDTTGGLLYGGFVAHVVIWHATFCINSVAHWMGSRNYAADISARGNLVAALITNGEGYHNFHHAFPRDYRNG